MFKKTSRPFLKFPTTSFMLCVCVYCMCTFKPDDVLPWRHKFLGFPSFFWSDRIKITGWKSSHESSMKSASALVIRCNLYGKYKWRHSFEFCFHLLCSTSLDIEIILDQRWISANKIHSNVMNDDGCYSTIICDKRIDVRTLQTIMHKKGWARTLDPQSWLG